MDIREAIEKYRPCCEQEARDKAVILSFIDSAPDAFERSNLIAHMTASAWVVNPARDKVLSPRKMRYVVDMIRGMEVNRALGVLRFSKKQASGPPPAGSRP